MSVSDAALKQDNGSPIAGDAAFPTSEVPEEITGQPRRVATGKVRLRDIFSALRHRNFRLFFIGQLVSLMGTWMQNTAQSWLIYQMTGSKLLLGIIAAAGTAPMLFFSTVGGSIADRFPKRTIVLIAQAAMMILAFALAALTAFHLIKPAHLIILAALGGVAMAFDMPARQAFLIEITSRDDLMNAISLNSAIVNGARVVGPAVAGLLMARTGPAICFLINGVSFLAVLAGLLMMRLPRRQIDKPAGSPLEHILEGFRYVLDHPRLKTVFTLFAIVGVFGWSYSVLMPAFATDILGVDENHYGLLLGANGLGALCGALTVAAVGSRFTPRQLAFSGLALFSATLIALGMVGSFLWAMILLLISGWGMMLFFATVNTLLQTTVTDRMRGRVMGIWALVFGGMMPLGSLEAGTLSHYFGVSTTITVGGVICAMAGAITWIHVQRRLPAHS